MNIIEVGVFIAYLVGLLGVGLWYFIKDKDGNILLGDEISPDGCRLWDAETLEMLDKELFRKGKDNEVMDAYIEVYNRVIPDDEKVI